MFLTPILRTLGQLDDPVFLGAAWRSLAWAAAGFALLVAGIAWGGHAATAGYGWWSWLAALAGGVGALLLALLLFLPVATVIATLFIDRIAAAVEWRFYPGLPPPNPASLSAQAWDGVVLGLRVLAWQLLALLLAFVLPGVGLVLGWIVAAWAIGRGLFVAVAMRRMTRAAAQAEYRARRPAVLAQGGALAAISLVPLLNLLLPLLGAAAMVHVLHAPQASSPGASAPRPRV